MILLLLASCATTQAVPPARMASNCPAFGAPEVLGTVSDDRIHELSGIVASRTTPHTWWVHNDSGDTARVFAVGDDGATVSVLDLTDHTTAIDWEDIAIGPGPDGRPWLFIADTGDNRGVRSAIAVILVPEPAVPIADNADAARGTLVRAYQYPRGKQYNAEALFVDPRDGALYVVTKSNDGDSRVFTDPHPFAPPSGGEAEPRVLELVRTLQFGGAALPGSPKVTAGDLAPDGSSVVLRTYESAFLWPIAAGESVASALGGPPCPLPLAKEPQGEAIAFALDGEAYVTSSEGVGSPIVRYSAVTPGLQAPAPIPAP